MHKRVVSILVVLILAGLASAANAEFAMRAIWVDTGSYATPEAADKLIEKCSRAGINAILPNVMTHGAVFYRSSHFLHTVVANDKYDPLGGLIRKAHAAGIQVHPWFNAYYEGVKGLTPAKPDWLCCDIDGKRMSDSYFLSPANPEVNPYVLSVIKDALNYDIDGIHLDYIRYFGTTFDYSEIARRRFQESRGFDPINFLDGGDKIVPAEKDPFPIRVLRPDRQVSRIWETGWTERYLDCAGIGFAFISEKPENIDALKVPGILILSCYYNVSSPILDALERYTERGGNVLWIDAPTSSARSGSELSKFIGLGGSHYIPMRFVKMTAVGEHPLSKWIPREPFNCSANNCPQVCGATVIARLDSGEPALTVKPAGKGRVVVIGLTAAQAGSAELVQLVRGTVDWLRRESGVAPGPDMMAAKRAQWIRWRADQVTDLVKSVRAAAKAKDEKIVMSASSGTSPSEYFACYKDGRRWLADGIIDCAFPMNYTDSPDMLREILKDQIAYTPYGKGNAVFPGLSLYTSKTVNGKRVNGSQDPQVVKQELDIVREMGYKGFILFASNTLSDEQIAVIKKAR